MKSHEVMQALAVQFEWWTNVVVPNVYLGQRSDEMDLAVVSKSGLLWEVEIKVSMADWKADLAKRKWKTRPPRPDWLGPPPAPDGSAPARFYYAVPEGLLPEIPGAHWSRTKYVLPEWLPGSAGVLRIYKDDERTGVHIVRSARPLHRNPLPVEMRLELMRKLGMRYWKHVAPSLASPTNKE